MFPSLRSPRNIMGNNVSATMYPRLPGPLEGFVKVLVNEDTLLRTHCCPSCFLGCANVLGNICCGHKMFPNKIRNIFVCRTQNLCPQQMLREQANGETFVSATMCPQQCVLVCQGLKEARTHYSPEILSVFNLPKETADILVSDRH